MRFAVIENREWSGPASQPRLQARSIQAEDVEAEARRRKASLGLDEWRVREYVTGTPMPVPIRNASLQIEYAAQALCRLSPIPADYADDVYWPRAW